MSTAKDIVQADLNYIRDRLDDLIDELAGRRLLITGGAGFLGYYLVQSVLHWNRSLAAGRRIRLTVFDNFIRGMPRWLQNHEADECLALVRQDVTQPLPAAMDGFDYIMHAASIASPTYYRKHPIETMDANVNGLRRLLDYCRQQAEKGRPVKGMLFFSSSEVYGDPAPDRIPTEENYNGRVSFTGPRACYDESKRYGETMCVNFARHCGLAVKMVRPFNNYGPGLKISDRRVIPDFAGDLLAGRDLVMYSDGRPTRTFCYVADAVVGYYQALLKGAAGEAYNIGTQSPEVSMKALAQEMARIAGALWGYGGSVRLETSAENDYLTDNPHRRCPCIAKARADIGFDPRIGLSEGLERSLIWYREHNQGEDA